MSLLRPATILLVAGLAAPAHAQWTVTILNPATTPQSYAFSVNATRQVGYALVNDQWHAGLWTGAAATWVDLHPPAPNETSEGWGIGGKQQCGRVRNAGSSQWRACLWTGTAASFVDLNPAGAGESTAAATNGVQQVGWANLGAGLRASLWTGTAASWTDLTPATAAAGAILGVHDNQQVGWARIDGTAHAGRWSGSAGTWVDMNPASAWGSALRDTDGIHQVGDSADFGTFIGRAGLWTGTAASWIDLSPPGTTDSVAYGVAGDMQVGRALIPGVGVHAFAWRSTAESAVDLNSFLPSLYVGSEARGVRHDASGNFIVVGFGVADTNARHAIVWKFAAPPAPCYANCDGSTATPALTANDFQCFINKYAANDPSANCDGSTAIPALTANDFQCFINKYAAGCT